MSQRINKGWWAGLLALAALAALAAGWLFPQAMPLLQLQATLSRDQALAAAAALQARQFPDLVTARAAVRFDHDPNLQHYIELEAGGVEAYGRLFGQRFVAPYHWTVRRFAESREDELSVRFTPEGHAYGYLRKIPEQAPGPALPEAEARILAEAGARALLGEELWAAYEPLSASHLKQPSGRVDHTFVYEHRLERRGEARFRLKLAVAGDRLVEVMPYAFIPEAFLQRLAQLRGGNEAIASAATVATALLFGLGGLLWGGLWLARHGGLAWRPALVAGAIVGALLAAMAASNIPRLWFDYGTAGSASNFLVVKLATALGIGAAATLLLGLIFAVADGLSRQAFASHPRLFSLWSPAAGASPQVLGRTLAGYAWAACHLLLVVGFYLVARHQFGWWLPAESLNDPNILAAWRPGLAPIALALQAGTMEEALFRAVPLAGAALIGERLGWRRSAIALALVAQALVFAGAHANYPGLPAYSRLVELFVPALIWGLVFLRFGLLPCIVMHFTFDLALMSLPLFVTSDPGLWPDRALVLAAGLFPLLMIARARWRQGHFANLPEAMRHGVARRRPSAVPTAIPTATPTATRTATPTAVAGGTALPPRWLRRGPLVLAAALGSAAILLLQPAPVPTPPFTLDHAGAVARAEAQLAEQGVQLGADWKRLAIVRPAAAGDSKAVRFVWREAGPEVFARLLGTGMLPQHWQVQFKHAGGPAEQRSEVWEVALTGQGELLAVEHHLPEGRPGPRLGREEAEARVRGYMAEQPDLAGRPWELASVEQKERPARRDWTFYWDDRQALDVKGGTSRLSVTVRGDELAAWRYVAVPQAWVRDQELAEGTRMPFRIAAGLSGALLVLVVLVATLRQVLKAPLRWRPGLAWAALWLTVSLAGLALNQDRRALMFNVAQDWQVQSLVSAALAATGFLVLATLLGLLAMRLPAGGRQGNGAVGADLLRGLVLALVLQGVETAVRRFLPEHDPLLPGVGVWESIDPLWAAAFQGVTGMGAAIAVVALALGAAQFCRSRRRLLALAALAALLAVSYILAADTPATALGNVVWRGLALLLLWALVERGEVGVAVAMLGLAPIAKLPESLALPVASAGTQAALACAVAVSLTWWAVWLRRSAPGASGGPS